MTPLTSSSTGRKIASARPMRSKPTVSVAIPNHMYAKIVRPRNATDRRPVNTQTEPGQQNK